MADAAGPQSTGTDKVNWARSRCRQFKSACSEWTEDAISAYALVAGDQWPDEAKGKLEADNRPVFTFNRVAGFIRGICGLETSTRNQVQLFAREVKDSGVNDVLNAAVRYVREGCDADDEESDAFKDMLTCGLGWTETLFSTENDIDGEIIIERIDPLHMRWDPAARKRGLIDTRWRARDKWLDLSVIADVWGQDKADELQSQMDGDDELLEELMGKPHDATEAHLYENDQGGGTRYTSGIKVTQFQYVKTCKYVRFINPLTQEVDELEPDEFEKLAKKAKKAKIDIGPTQIYKRRQYRQCIYCGPVELEDGPLPCQGFTLQAITGIRDRNKGIWYGFVRDLEDPQTWINKFFSSMADVVASQAKGGLLAEVDAFINKDDAEDDWADPRKIVWLKRDGLAKVKERASQGVPAGISQLLDFTVDSLPNVAGVNLEFLGLAGREQPGVLEHQRKQAAISTLAEFFNALRLYRKQQGRILLAFINEFISDGRLIRISGDKNAPYVELAKRPDTLKYDVVVDEAPTSPDQKERTWGALTQILPVAANLGLPVPPEVLKYAPFPQALIDDWLKYAQEGGMSPDNKAKMQQMQEQLGALQKENESLKSKKEESMAKIQLEQQTDQAKLQLEQQKAQAGLQLERDQFLAEMQLEREKLTAEIQLEREKATLQLGMQREQATHQQRLAEFSAQSAVSKAEGEGVDESGANALLETIQQRQDDMSRALESMAAALEALAKAQPARKGVEDSSEG